MTDLINMGGHGFYIWTSYAVVIAVLVFGIVIPIRHHKHLINEIAKHHKSSK
ncbi:MAG: heme exporter protein CcmD [Gammaproteobacteria bacterium]|nr:heme exporter protein CcmD [Gammaproteobacteria bacterium]MCY4218644.1 heme exporter protein CcmD [Gammaproteobacteria bacterium]MCY4275584.1 heme exporter protein CcmD [Gammaproteobacteria bacterium]